MAQKVLVVDDDQRIVYLIKTYLTHANFEVITSYDGTSALTEISENQPDLIILDLMLPEVTGEEICKYVREVSDVPIIMLTAKIEAEQRIYGLDLGADDYIIKPFSPGELVARVKAVLRRTSETNQEILVSKDKIINLLVDKHEVFVNNVLIKLTPTEYKLLVLFIQNPGKVFSKTALAERVFGWEYEGYEDTIYVHVKNLRQKMEKVAAKRYIKTVYGVGYRWDE